MEVKLEDFKVGCKVRLKSGGREMVVATDPNGHLPSFLENKEESKDLVYCQWHNGSGDPCSQRYSYQNLVLVED